MRKIIKICSLFILFAIATYAQDISMTIADATAETAGEVVTVPINVANFTNVGAVTLKIQFDPAVVTFDSSSRAGEFLANEAGGTISIGRAMLTAVTPTTGELLKLYFTYIGGATDITFDAANCEIANTSGNVITGVTYNDGVLSNPNLTTTVGLSTVVAPGATATVDLNVTNFDNVGAVTWKITYNPAVLEFESVSDVNFLANAVTPGELVIVRASLTPVAITDGKLLDIEFNYLGGGTDLSFVVADCEVANALGEVITGILYSDGRVVEEEIIVEIMDVPAAVDAPVVVPVNVTNFDNVGAVTWKIQYDPFVATYDSITGQSDFIANAVSGELSIVRAGLTAITPTDGKLLDLHFTCIGPLGSSTALNFNLTTSEIADVEGNVINGITYENGGIQVTDDVKPVPGLPTEYKLNQNFPNPFNPSTIINFSIPEYSFVVLKVYNLLGQEVVTLVNKDLPAANYEYKFDATNMTSGAYIYKITAGDFVSTKKMLFIK
jgi:hypothetical protein